MLSRFAYKLSLNGRTVICECALANHLTLVSVFSGEATRWKDEIVARWVQLVTHQDRLEFIQSTDLRKEQVRWNNI